MPSIELRRMNATLKGEFAWVREAAVVNTNHDHASGTGVVLRLKAYLRGRKELTADFLLTDGKPTKKKQHYNLLSTRLNKLVVTHASTITTRGNVTNDEVLQTCADIVAVLSGGKPVTFEEIMKKLEQPAHELRKFNDSEILEPANV